MDGTKLAGNGADIANRTLAKLHAEAAELLRQAAAADRRDDQQHGAARGDELPPALASKAGRLARLRQAAARQTHERALHIKERVYGPDHHQVAITLTNLGTVLRQLGELPAARQAFERAVGIFRATLGVDHAHTRQVQHPFDDLFGDAP